MADESITRMNLSAIKKIDPYAKEIVDSSSHVAFYTFNSDQNEWEKTDVEGAFFIYHRNAEPFHSIFINNRLNTTSFVEPITGSLELQSQPPFLLYRNERSRIRGFWFYNSEECDRISNLVNGLLLSKETNGGQQPLAMLNYPKPENSSIFNMLSQAQKEYNAQMNSPLQPPQPSGTAISQTEAMTSGNVMKFFQSAKQATAEALLNRPQPLSVDQLEKQQRSVTPVETPSQSFAQDGGEFVGAAESPLSPFLKAASGSAIPRNAAGKPLSLLSNMSYKKNVNESPASALIATDDAEQCLRRLLVGDKPDAKPALMPPTMFDVPPAKVVETEQLAPLSQPLNSAQFVQAFTYLIQNDKEFVTKLHNAYVNGCSNSLIDSNTTYQ
ncbi:mRNA-decapping enzyme 1B [Drosophila sulfurigaster albostrigata]|uniref:mRNA-decapping enzyme 1B n=1 Tax=Drosophila sulfurigaster albostrigata TaxID=89887 RepID=UPI002D21847A|nr:mRNA-decapping enzyme 1B [Drosophila sulfurigaster albostrigata]